MLDEGWRHGGPEGRQSIGGGVRGEGGAQGRVAGAGHQDFGGSIPRTGCGKRIWEQDGACTVLQSLINGFSLDGTRHQS